jgi:hypothetical protein
VHEREKASAESLVTELDELVPRDGACVTLRQYGGGPDESRITANQRGYLRLGIEFLKAAFAPTNKENSLKADIGYLLTEDSDVGFDWFERREDLPLPLKPGRRRRIVASAFALGCLVFVAALAVVGLIAVVKWLL